MTRPASLPTLCLAWLVTGLAGCSGGSDGGLAPYTAAGYPTPAGYWYPDPRGLGDAIEGFVANPGPLDASVVGVPVPGSPIEATAAYAAYLQGIGDRNSTLVSVAVRLSQPPGVQDWAILAALCQAEGDGGMHLLDVDVHAVYTWRGGNATSALGRGLVDQVVAATGAQRLC